MSTSTLFYPVSLYLFPNLYSYILSPFTQIALQIYFAPFSSSPVLLLPHLWLRITVPASSLLLLIPSNGKCISPHSQPYTPIHLKWTVILFHWYYFSLLCSYTAFPVLKGKFKFMYKSPLSRYMHNQKLSKFILKLGKNPSQLILPDFCTQVCKQHDPISQQC